MSDSAVTRILQNLILLVQCLATISPFLREIRECLSWRGVGQAQVFPTFSTARRPFNMTILCEFFKLPRELPIFMVFFSFTLLTWIFRAISPERSLHQICCLSLRLDWLKKIWSGKLHCLCGMKSFFNNKYSFHFCNAVVLSM